METIKGRLDHIRYQGDNHWTVASLLVNHTEVTIVGNLIDAEEGDSLELTGDWHKHKKFGKQFKIHSCRVLVPYTDEGVIGFLESRLRNIGRARAFELVRHFGADKIFDVILNHPDRLTEISGITNDRAQQIHVQYKESQKLRDTIVFLKQFRLTDNQVAKIISAYGLKNTRAVVEENPYKLIEDINGFGFKTVDGFALRMGVDHDGIDRAKAGCVFVLQVARNEGHTYLPRDEYRTKVGTELNSLTCVDEAVEALRDNDSIVVEGNRVYDGYLHKLECSVATMLATFARS